MQEIRPIGMQYANAAMTSSLSDGSQTDSFKLNIYTQNGFNGANELSIMLHEWNQTASS